MTETLTLTGEMIAVLCILGLTIVLFVSEVVRVDVAAILVMVLIGLSALVPGYEGLVAPGELFAGFATNAVISIIAVMIIGVGLDKTGLMSLVAGKILQYAGTTEKRIIPAISGTVGFISSFMQNIGAAALFLPVVSRISRSTQIPMSRLLMPMGFCAILGGTMTMIGSSPLILLNDLLITANVPTFDLFDVTPIGIAMILTGIVYFVVFGRFVLPSVRTDAAEPGDTAKYFRDLYGIEGDVFELVVTDESDILAWTLGKWEADMGHTVSVLATRNGDILRVGPARDTDLWIGSELALLGTPKAVQAIAERYKFAIKPGLDTFSDILQPSHAGISEVVIPPGSEVIGRTISELKMRVHYRTNILAVYRGEATIDTDLRDVALRAGDALVLHSRWEDLEELSHDQNFAVVTDFPKKEETRPEKIVPALIFFGIAFVLVLTKAVPLSVALMVGAMGMVVSRVLSIDEAYRAVGWQSVFLLASLFSLGTAVENTQTAAWIAQETVQVLGDVPTWGYQLAIALLATFFTLVMSNVGATVLLVPIAINIALQTGANPALFALTVALATSNSFLIPTHQVNALILEPGGYRVADFMRAGGIMTVLFIAVLMFMLNVLY
ncbi:MAG: SLC13 family permease [Pseudomonadota bacterium]|nr:MAG: SLC13 family permease [Pseudomonadota bacterium]